MTDAPVTAGSTGIFDQEHPPSRALLDKCVHCGFCLPTCPTYMLWGEEMNSPRGRLYLMKAGLDGRVSMSPEFVDHFDDCLGCVGTTDDAQPVLARCPQLGARRRLDAQQPSDA